MSNEEPLVIPETLRVQLAEDEIVELPLEEYLKGVVPTEMGLAKPVEALRAQAIAARSYAVSTRRHACEGFDVCVTTHCQVYKPENRYEDADQAIDGTAGQVVTHKNHIVGTPFFAHCDGNTRNSEDVWSGIVPFLRSVPCICGHDELYGHGAGMCQRGAAAMAESGASAEEILAHYYTDTAVGLALHMPRDTFERSIIVGVVVDPEGNPRAGTPVLLSGSETRKARRTNAEGKFFVSGLPAGVWELRILHRELLFQNLVTDGRNTLDLRFVVPDIPHLAASTMPLAYPRELAGTLGYKGVNVAITDPLGNELTVVSGSAEEYNPGGFAVPLESTGLYKVHVLGQSFDVKVDENGAWVQFDSQSE